MERHFHQTERLVDMILPLIRGLWQGHLDLSIWSMQPRLG